MRLRNVVGIRRYGVFLLLLPTHRSNQQIIIIMYTRCFLSKTKTKKKEHNIIYLWEFKKFHLKFESIMMCNFFFWFSLGCHVYVCVCILGLLSKGFFLPHFFHTFFLCIFLHMLIHSFFIFAILFIWALFFFCFCCVLIKFNRDIPCFHCHYYYYCVGSGSRRRY